MPTISLLWVNRFFVVPTWNFYATYALSLEIGLKNQKNKKSKIKNDALNRLGIINTY